ncbi:MAG TPA: hypothetical protein VLQ78_11575 [Ornithinibacter sp.]|nr:hypothetical protein [Ornithinibacter sp.]
MTSDPQGVHRRLEPADLAHLDFVEQVFLVDARAAGYVTPAAGAALEGLLTTMRAEALGPATPEVNAGLIAVEARQTLPVETQPALAPAPHQAPRGATRQPRTPSALAQWWKRTRTAVGSDLAVHGLAYLGVLLFFVGAFGLVVFAFGDVAPALRPVAEAVIALVPFGAAALLLRRGATVVGRALEVVGGLLLPVMVITTFLDGFPVPPDLEGGSLVVTLTVLTSLVAVGYAVWSRRHPDSALRFLVAPVAWLAVAMATLGLGPRDIPDGKAVATPSAAQGAAMTAALVATLVWARLRPTHRLAVPTSTVSLPGLVVIGALSVLSWAAEGYPFVPVLVTGLLVLVALELLSDRIPATSLGVVEPVWWALASLGMAQGSGDLGPGAGAVAAMSAAVFLALLEVAGAARRSALALALPALGLAAALVATTADPWWAVAALGVASVWAGLRRTAPVDVRGAAGILDAATAVLPALALANLAAASDLPTAALTGAVLVVVATALVRRHLLTRRPDDRFWSIWWAVATAVVLVVTTGALAGNPSWTDGQRWTLVATLALLTTASAAGPVGARWHPPVVTGLATLTWVAAAGILDLSTVAVTSPVALAGLAMVVVAHTAPPRPPASPASLGLTGHALGLLTVLAAAPDGWARVITVGLATAGWTVTGWRDAQGRSVVGAAFARVARWVVWVPLTLGAGGILLTASLLLDRTGLLPLDDPWSVAVPVVAAVGYAVASRLPLPRRVVAVTAWAGFLSGVLAAAWATTRPTAVLALAAIPAAVLLLRPARRTRVMTWTGWLVAAPAVGLLAAETWPWFESLPVATAVALTLVAVGSALRLGGAAADLRDGAWTPRLLPAHPSALPPVVLGAAELVLGLLTALALVPGDESGWIFVAAAVVLLVTAVLTRAGVIGGAATLVGWVAVLLLALPRLEEQPWIAVVTALVLLLAAEGLSRLSTGPAWWARWDVPVLVAVAPVAVTALVVSAEGPSAAATSAAIGAQCLAVAARLRRHRPSALVLGAVGTALVLGGAATAGPGWLALSLLGLSVALTWLAIGAEGTARTALQVGGAIAAVAAWRSAAVWLDVPGQQVVEITALAAATLTVVATAAASRTRVDRSWVLVWGGAAVLVETVCAWVALAPAAVLWPAVEPSWPVASALAVVAASLAVAASAVGVRWLRDLAMAFGLLALLGAMVTAGATVTDQVVVLSLLSVVVAAATLTVARGPHAPTWLRPLVEVGAASTLWAFLLASTTSSGTMLLVLVLAAAAVQAAAVGVALRRTLLQMASPVLAVAAWVVFTEEALGGNPQWVTVPMGLAVLVAVALWRRDRAELGLSVSSPEIVALEMVGIAFLAGASVVQSVTESVVYAALTAAIGLAVTAWGVVSRVRRRVAAGLGLVLVAVALLVGVPLVQLLPSWEGAGLWVLIGGVGLVVILVAVFLERGKAAARSGLARFAETTSGWE